MEGGGGSFALNAERIFYVFSSYAVGGGGGGVGAQNVIFRFSAPPPPPRLKNEVAQVPKNSTTFNVINTESTPSPTTTTSTTLT